MIMNNIIQEEMSKSKALSEQHASLIDEAILRGALYIQQSPEHLEEVLTTIDNLASTYEDFSHQSAHIERTLRLAYYKQGKILEQAKVDLAPFPNHSFEKFVQEIGMDLASAERLIQAVQEIDNLMREHPHD
jgi:polyhydroxyalkanoate synthesis regulator phasin